MPKPIDSSLAQMLTFDTSGIELYVTENNPKTLNALIRKLKAYYKDKPGVDPYKMAYSLMPSQAAACPDAKQMYINGHFCYTDKFCILTNGSALSGILFFWMTTLRLHIRNFRSKRTLILRKRIKPSAIPLL